MGTRVFGNFISGSDVGISVPDGSDVDVFSNTVTGTRVAIEMRDAIPAPLQREILNAIRHGRTEDEIRADLDPALRKAGTSFDTWLGRAGNLAALGSLLAQLLMAK